MSETLKIKLGTKELTILILIIALAFFYFNYSWTGLRLLIGPLLLFFVPFYIFLDSFNLPTEEKLIFPFFIGIGIVPLLVFYLTKILVSLRISILVTFILLIIGSLIFRKFYKK
jgi:hypothetical protein